MARTSPLEGTERFITFIKALLGYFIFQFIGLPAYLIGISILGRVQHGAKVVADWNLILAIGFTIYLLFRFYENIKLNVDRRTNAEVALAQYAYLSGASDDAGIAHNSFWGTLFNTGLNSMGFLASALSVLNTPHVGISTIFINVVICFSWCWACYGISRRWLKKLSVDEHGRPNGVGIMDKPENYRDWANNMLSHKDRQRFRDLIDRQSRDDENALGDRDDDNDDDDEPSPPRRY